jgi:LacI family transcriptional regulator
LLRSQTKSPATVFDVASASGVSTATVSRAMSGKAAKVAPDTLQRVRAAATRLGYTPSEIGRSLRRTTTRMVVLLVPDATNDFCADVAVSLERSLQQAGYSMVLGNTSEDAARQDQLLGDAQALRPFAIILLGAIDTAKLREVARSKCPVVFINRKPPAGIRATFVGIDNEAAGRAVASHFLRKGFTDCAVIHGPLKYSASRLRLQGFVERMKEAAIELPRIWRIESALTMDAGYEHGLELMRSDVRPRAIFCGNDMIAYGIYRAAHEANLRIPEDIAICGFDDNRVNAWLAPWLTTVHVPALDFGPAVVTAIQSNTQQVQARDVILPFSLTLRQSA